MRKREPTPTTEYVVESCGNVFTDLGLKVCGNCYMFTLESKTGDGWCSGYTKETTVKKTCKKWAPDHSHAKQR